MRRIAKTPSLVASHQFFPFLKFDDEWQPFRRKKGKVAPKPDRKVRTIRYASRRDAAVFSYYRWLLAGRYEQKLAESGLASSVLAYRRVVGLTGGGKSNINFAHEAFCAIQDYDGCAVVALDISKFFESLDHARLAQVWAWLLGTPKLPPDHAHVFKNITRYADVSRDEAYVRLGHAKWENVGSGRYLKILSNPIPLRLATMSEFREKIIGRNSTFKSMIQRHEDEFGVPQGAPLSDLLANAYLFEFDEKMQAYVQARGGRYFRYSDDILIVLPGADKPIAQDAEAFAQAEIKNIGQELRIKETKTSAYIYRRETVGHSFSHLKGKGANGLEYLGFRFDGRFAHVRSSTLSRLHRNITFAARAVAHNHVARYPGKTLGELVDLFDIGAFMQKFGRVREFSAGGDPEDWTFWTYAQRSRTVFEKMGAPIEKQLSRYRKFTAKRVGVEIRSALGL